LSAVALERRFQRATLAVVRDYPAHSSIEISNNPRYYIASPRGGARQAYSDELRGPKCTIFVHGQESTIIVILKFSQDYKKRYFGRLNPQVRRRRNALRLADAFGLALLRGRFAA